MAPQKDEAIDSSMAQWKLSLPGRMMTSTPMKPTTTAIQRLSPTCSPRIGTESAQTQSGMVKKIAAVCASCR
jgi:hypothetical protein